MTSASPLKKILLALATMLGLIGGVGCELPINPNSGRWHQKFGWNAKDYFADAKVIDLCNAIEKNDLPRMEQAIRDGANVNCIGKGGMTPLLWAYPDGKFERFECLLKHGADASVTFESDFNTLGRIMVGSNLSHLAAESEFPLHFISIMKHGGNPNLMFKWSRANTYERTLFHSIFRSFCKNKKERCEAVINAGASKAILLEGARLAVQSDDEYEIALSMLKAGADFESYDPYDGKFIHIVARRELASFKSGKAKRAQFERLVSWLEEQGEDYEAAKKDEQKWLSWLFPDTTKGDAMRRADIANRMAKEESNRARQSKEK